MAAHNSKSSSTSSTMRALVLAYFQRGPGSFIKFILSSISFPIDGFVVIFGCSLSDKEESDFLILYFDLK